MGLTLRRLEKYKNSEKLDKLKEIIRNKYDTKGLHIAQIVQNGIFSKYVGIILGPNTNPQKLRFEINSLFQNVDNTIAFIQNSDDPDKKAKEICIKINANSPKTFIISSFGTAMDVCDKIKESIIKEISDYECELYATKNRRIYFLNKTENVDII